ncbi:LIM-type zinc finger-containing protein [Reticulomyxa filosa]|uniref:LIM-type zinc finger-containing protein n=1 Tax=Reticulomyxa filosa TaxID=46433 RepID=X6NEP5_RETFI|nr:LIM-type zinc finger-containing protein [Reticulomyxa filosa]|eukprot:ETO24431.1 LIM-type zinc finger-containing protein [Reticulomyxa filosa]
MVKSRHKKIYIYLCIYISNNNNNNIKAKKYEEKMAEEKNSERVEDKERIDMCEMNTEDIATELKKKTEELGQVRNEKEMMLNSITKENILLKTSNKELVDYNEKLKEQLKAYDQQMAEHTAKHVVCEDEVTSLKLQLNNYRMREQENIDTLQQLNQQLLDLSTIRDKYQLLSQEHNDIQMKHNQFQVFKIVFIYVYIYIYIHIYFYVFIFCLNERRSCREKAVYITNKAEKQMKRLRNISACTMTCCFAVKNWNRYFRIFVITSKVFNTHITSNERRNMHTTNVSSLTCLYVCVHVLDCKPNVDLDELLHTCVAKLVEKTYQLEQRSEQWNTLLTKTVREKEIEIRKCVKEEMKRSIGETICRSIVHDLIGNVVTDTAVVRRQRVSTQMVMSDKLIYELYPILLHYNIYIYIHIYTYIYIYYDCLQSIEYTLCVRIRLNTKRESLAKEQARLDKLADEVSERERFAKKNLPRLDGQLRIMKRQKKAMQLLVYEIEEHDRRFQRLREDYSQMNEIKEADERFQNEQLKELTHLLGQKQQECESLVEKIKQMQACCEITEQKLVQFKQLGQQKEKDFQLKFNSLKDELDHLAKERALHLQKKKKKKKRMLQIELKQKDEQLKERDRGARSPSQANLMNQEKYSELKAMKDNLMMEYDACQKDLQNHNKRFYFTKFHASEEGKQALATLEEKLKNEHLRWTQVTRENEQLILSKEALQKQLSASKNKIAQLQAECSGLRGVHEDVKQQSNNSNVHDTQQFKEDNCNELKQRMEAEKQVKQYQSVCQAKDEEIAMLQKAQEEGRQRRQQLREMIESTRKEAQEKIQKSSESYRVMKNLTHSTPFPLSPNNNQQIVVWGLFVDILFLLKLSKDLSSLLVSVWRIFFVMVFLIFKTYLNETIIFLITHCCPEVPVVKHISEGTVRQTTFCYSLHHSSRKTQGVDGPFPNVKKKICKVYFKKPLWQKGDRMILVLSFIVLFFRISLASSVVKSVVECKERWQCSGKNLTCDEERCELVCSEPFSCSNLHYTFSQKVLQVKITLKGEWSGYGLTIGDWTDEEKQAKIDTHSYQRREITISSEAKNAAHSMKLFTGQNDSLTVLCLAEHSCFNNEVRSELSKDISIACLTHFACANSEIHCPRMSSHCNIECEGAGRGPTCQVYFWALYFSIFFFLFVCHHGTRSFHV